MMTTTAAFPEDVTIVDDDRMAAFATKEQVEDLGYNTTLITEGHYTNVAQLLKRMRIGETCVLCDHRLQHGGLANFYGAEVISELYKAHSPGLLLTQFSDQDADTSIRRFRRRVPVLLPRSEISPDTIQLGIREVWNEIRGIIPPARIPYRTLVEIVDLSNEAGEDVVDVIVPGWDPKTAVRLPLGLIPYQLHERIRVDYKSDSGAYVFAQVNIGATDADSLFFESFEEAPSSENSPLDQTVAQWLAGGGA